MTLSERMRNRGTEEYLIALRNGRSETYDQWHSRINENDVYIRGEFPVTLADGSTVVNKPIVGNLMDQMPRDLARLANEVEPTYRAPAFGDSKTQLDNAILRGVIGEGYFQKNRFDIIRPQLVMDLAVTGAAFLVVWVDPTSEYPRMLRMDPRACFPDIHNGEILDLLVSQELKVRIADRVYPGLNLLEKYLAARGSDDGASDYAEVMNLWAPDECVTAVALKNASGTVLENGLSIVARWKPNLRDGRPPVAFAQIPSPDGALRGLLDQIGPGIVAKNQIASYILEYSEQMVHAPFEYKGITNPTDPPGPNTLYAHDPMASNGESFMRRVAPASTNPQLFDLMNFMDSEQRSQVAYPASRQGDVSQSIASASFVQATQGQLSSLTRDVQQRVADMQEQAGLIAQQLDVTELDYEKPLHRSIGRKRTYKPSRDIGEHFGLEVNYGAGSGLDRLNTDVRLIQFYGAGAISLETLLENVDFVADPVTEIEKRQREEVMRIVLQRWAGDPNTAIDFMIRLAEIQDQEGATFREALQAVNQEMEAQVQQQQQQGLLGQGAQTAGGTQEQVPTQGELTAGSQPSGEPIVEPSFSPAPLEQVFVAPQR